MAQDEDAIFRNTIGEVVKIWREARNLTVTELAQRSGRPITKGYISQLENNKIHQPNDDYLVRIAEALQIPVLYLITRRLPSELSPDEQKGIKEEGGFTFGSPLSSPRRKQLEEKEALQEILAQLDELRRRVKKLIAQRGRER